MVANRQSRRINDDNENDGAPETDGGAGEGEEGETVTVASAGADAGAGEGHGDGRSGRGGDPFDGEGEKATSAHLLKEGVEMPHTDGRVRSLVAFKAMEKSPLPVLKA